MTNNLLDCYKNLAILTSITSYGEVYERLAVTRGKS